MNNKIIANECYMCERFNTNENRQRNKLWCFCFCDYYTQAQIEHNYKVLGINVEELNELYS